MQVLINVLTSTVCSPSDFLSKCTNTSSGCGANRGHGSAMKHIPYCRIRVRPVFAHWPVQPRTVQPKTGHEQRHRNGMGTRGHRLINVAQLGRRRASHNQRRKAQAQRGTTGQYETDDTHLGRREALQDSMKPMIYNWGAGKDMKQSEMQS